MKDLFVFDRFKTLDAAETVANQLVDLGVPRLAIILGAERDLSDETRTDFKVVNGSELADADDKEETSLWDRIVGMFQSEEDANEAAIDFDGYRSALALGEVLLLVEEEFRLMIDKTVEVATVDEPQIPTDSDNRIERGGSFASEDLNYHSPDGLDVPLKEINNENSLSKDPINLDRDFEKDPHR